MIAHKACVLLVAIMLAQVDSPLPDDGYYEETPWLRVEYRIIRGFQAYTYRVVRRSGSGWVEVPNAYPAAALDEGCFAFIRRAFGYAIIDEQGHERARLPCASWLSADARRIYCATTPAPKNAAKQTVALRIWSSEGVLLEQHASSVPPVDRPGVQCAGHIQMIGIFVSGEAAIEQICAPVQLRDWDGSALGRLFALRGDKLVQVASVVSTSFLVGQWRARLPKGVLLQEGGRSF